MRQALSDIREVKKLLSIDPGNIAGDAQLLFLIEQATDWIEEVLNRSLFYAARSEFYAGSGSQKLLLRSRPVYLQPAPPVVYLDECAYYGSATGSFDPNTSQLTYGKDYALELDSEDGTSSRSGILIRINDYWPKPTVREAGWLSPFIGDSFGVLKIVYTAGYSLDNLPATFRFALTYLVAKMRNMIPLGMMTTGEGYEERAVSYFLPSKRQWLSEVWQMVGGNRNWKW